MEKIFQSLIYLYLSLDGENYQVYIDSLLKIFINTIEINIELGIYNYNDSTKNILFTKMSILKSSK